MVVRVRLEGLNIVRARGKWYVYRRATGEALITGFEGERADLEREMANPDFVSTYNRPRRRGKPAKDFGGETLGGLAHWFTNGDIDRTEEERKDPYRFEGGDGYPKWKKLAEATRKDYLAAYDYLRDEFDIALSDIEQSDLYELRDACANNKWPRFADKMIAALSSMFKQGVKRSRTTGMKANPCLGMDKVHEADPNANREWFPEEWQAAIDVAPMEVKIPLMLARNAGLRGQTIVVVNWKQYRDDPTTGKCFKFTAGKNDERGFVPVTAELQDFLASLKVRTPGGPIALRDDGSTWPSEKEMQTRVSHWLRDRERDGLIGAGTTLHGLRVSYAAWWKRNGASDGEVADLLADKSERMGKHYTRHVEREVNVIRAFNRVKDSS